MDRLHAGSSPKGVKHMSEDEPGSWYHAATGERLNAERIQYFAMGNIRDGNEDVEASEEDDEPAAVLPVQCSAVQCRRWMLKYGSGLARSRRTLANGDREGWLTIEDGCGGVLPPCQKRA